MPGRIEADAYAVLRLLSGEQRTAEAEWVTLDNPAGGLGISFQSQSDYRRPTWPSEPGPQHGEP